MSAGQRQSLMLLARSSTAAHSEVKRATVLLMVANGVVSDLRSSRRLGLPRSPSTRGRADLLMRGYRSLARSVKGVAANP